jgi:hypothetical protein
MGNRYGPRLDEFAWNLGVLRRLKRYLQAELSYAECALLLGCSRGSVAYGVTKLKEPKLTPEEVRERRQRRAFERASHGLRARNKIAEESTYIESWKDYTARRKKERGGSVDSLPSS